MPAIDIFPSLGELGHPWECGLCDTVCLWYYPWLGLGFWGPWECRKWDGALPTWDIHMVKGFWAERVPMQRSGVVTQHHGLEELPAG